MFLTDIHPSQYHQDTLHALSVPFKYGCFPTQCPRALP